MVNCANLNFCEMFEGLNLIFNLNQRVGIISSTAGVSRFSFN